MEVSRAKLEKATASVAVVFLVGMVGVVTLIIANYALSWNLFSDVVERVGAVVVGAWFLMIISSVVINMMLNLGRIADFLDEKRKSR